MSAPKAIDVNGLTKESIKNITFEDLVNDAVARKDKTAYQFLCDQVAENDKLEPKKRKRLQSYRREYLSQFCGFKLGKKSKGPKSQQEKNQELLASVADAFKD